MYQPFDYGIPAASNRGFAGFRFLFASDCFCSTSVRFGNTQSIFQPGMTALDPNNRVLHFQESRWLRGKPERA